MRPNPQNCTRSARTFPENALSPALALTRHYNPPRDLRRKRLVDAAMRKHGMKSATKKTALLAAAEEEADETLDFLDSRAQLGEERVRGGDLQVKLKYRQDKEERLASVLEGAYIRSFLSCRFRRCMLGL